MYNFASDYLEGAHPQVMEALNKTNFIQTVGYGEDQYCQKAKDKIKAILAVSYTHLTLPTIA